MRDFWLITFVKMDRNLVRLVLNQNYFQNKMKIILKINKKILTNENDYHIMYP